MTLDEAVKYAEEVAESQEYKGKKLEESEEKYHDKYENYYASQCFECAKQHRQLAEWLKELKVYKEQQPCEDCISRKAVMNIIKKGMWHRQEIENLPSVQPTRKKEMSKYDS